MGNGQVQNTANTAERRLIGMSDREKVMQGLQELIDYLFHEYKVCYHGDEEDCYNRFLQADNAMNLLKEQEKSKKCKYCGRDIGKNWAWCAWCGRTVNYGA